MKIKTIALLLLFLAACVPAKTKTWVSTPSTREMQNADFSTQLTPLKRDKEHFVSFRLQIGNKTDRELMIDWNQTRYLNNGKNFGKVVFPSIDPATIQKSIPPATVPAGGTFIREIFPLKLVAFAPIRQDILDGEGRGLFPGPLPQGRNTVDLVIYDGKRQIRQQMTVDIIQN